MPYKTAPNNGTPGGNDAEDEHTVTEPNGKVMIATYPFGGSPDILQEFDPTTNTMASITPPPDGQSPYPVSYLNLPSGQVVSPAAVATGYTPDSASGRLAPDGHLRHVHRRRRASSLWPASPLSGTVVVAGRRVAMGRPFRVLGIQQIAIGALDRSALRRLWVDLLGVDVSGSFRNEAENVEEDILTLGTGPHAVEIDLMQPIDPAARPAVHEPALNHIGLWVDDLPAAVDWLAAQGVRFAPGGIRKGAGGHDVCFIHPKGTGQAPLGGQGVLIEMVQAPSSVVTALAAQDGFPTGAEK